jgi:hypothetical protein
LWSELSRPIFQWNRQLNDFRRGAIIRQVVLLPPIWAVNGYLMAIGW